MFLGNRHEIIITMLREQSYVQIAYISIQVESTADINSMVHIYKGSSTLSDFNVTVIK